MVKDGCGTTVHTAEDLTDGDFLTEAVIKYAERATQDEELMAQMEEKFRENFSMMTMQQQPKQAYYQKIPPPRRVLNAASKTSTTQPPR